MKKYIHTISGEPAFYESSNGQICYATRRQALKPVTLARIREEQRLTKIWRRKQGYDSDNDYGIQRIEV
jgi:hypothetical protein